VEYIDTGLDILWTVYLYTRESFAPLELLYSTLAVLGLYLARRATKRANVTISRLKRRKVVGPLLNLAERARRKCLGINGRMGGFLVIGLIALSLPPRQPAYGSLDLPVQVVSGFIFVGMEVWDVIDMIWDEVEWRSMLKTLRETNAHEIIVQTKNLPDYDYDADDEEEANNSNMPT
jgi:hypothetical protein